MRNAPSNRARTNAVRMNQRYSEGLGDVGRAMALEVFGANIDVNGYTTVAQANRLARALRLRRGVLLLDVGAGAGWPGLQIAQITGCSVVLADLPRPALARAVRRARREQLSRRGQAVQMTATALPFVPASFDAIVHTDVMC
jgi:2-polyprenyl-3-methyl-5-hydroxy-6-metoxy-1,4-benzoquinol methylase